MTDDERCIICGETEDENPEHDGITTGVHEFIPPSKSAEVQMWIGERREAFYAGMRASLPGFGSGTPITPEMEAAFERYAEMRKPRLMKTYQSGTELKVTP